MGAFLSDGVLDLRPVTRADLPQLAAWRNDPELRARTREWRPLTDADQEAWLQRISGGQRRDFMFVVDAHEGDTVRPIGVVGLCDWRPVDGTAEISFYIGDTAARGRGYARRALALLLEWGFLAVRLERIWAEVYAFNSISAHVLTKLGFTTEGRLRSHVYRPGGRVDALLLGLLVEEWRRRGYADHIADGVVGDRVGVVGHDGGGAGAPVVGGRGRGGADDDAGRVAARGRGVCRGHVAERIAGERARAR